MSEQQAKPQRPAPQIPSDMKAFNRKLIEEFRANKGQLSGQMAGRSLILLNTTGAKSGEARTTVLGFGRDGENFVVVASNNAAPEDPSWYRNLQAKPEGSVEIGAEKIKIRARTARGPERERMKALLPYFEGQQKQTKRELPLVILERV
jgi:deazaflavin-dependent oxidoreductase (nitroreductase family)